jgi:hypothetical protein
MGDRSKDKHLYKNKHDHIQIQLQNMFVTVELLYVTWGKRKRKGKENDRASVILHNIRCESRGYKDVC